ncbi:sensor histidine kinase [Stackebrandtia sp.]|jgi:signal transduction histidine kinase|uniref:sensor histidine kinase n=1 Tax=Stackebrandtia sp. TaxID=2023065 RepID=UPI0032C22D16
MAPLLFQRRLLVTSIADVSLAAALAGLAFVPTLSTIGAQIGDLPPRPIDPLGVILVLAQCVPLLARTRWPAGCLAVIGAAFAAHQALAYPQTFGSVGLYVALYSAGAHQVRFRRSTMAAAAIAYCGMAVTLHLLGSPNHPQDFVAYLLVLAVVWLTGTAMRSWRSSERQRRELAAELAAAAERGRIARELHDVVTHHVTAMVVQADAAKFLVKGDPERAVVDLGSIGGTGRRALTELRQLLGVLEATGESAADRHPAPGRIADLVERARESGQPIDFVEEGRRRPRPVDVELAAYRVAQEALTNALKYAARRPTRVRVSHEDDRLVVEVVTRGPSDAAPATGSGGRGLAGLRERLRMLDGELDTGTRPDGGFGVTALIPSRSAHDRRPDPRTDR